MLPCYPVPLPMVPFKRNVYFMHSWYHEIGSPEVVHAALELTTVLQSPGCCDYGHVPHYTSQEFLVQTWPCPPSALSLGCFVAD